MTPSEEMISMARPMNLRLTAAALTLPLLALPSQAAASAPASSAPVASATAATAATVPAARIRHCTRRQARWTSANLNAMWTHGRYIVHNNGWNAGGYNVHQRIFVCSKGNWRVRARMNNRSGDGAVKTYPNVHRDWHNWSTGHEPRLRTFRKIRAWHAHRTPRAGRYNAAYDVWLNGVPGRHELMIWTKNRKQRPAGRIRARNVNLGGRQWTIWATSRRHAGYIAYVPERNYRSGRTGVLGIIRNAKRRGLLSRRVTVGQIGYGFEIVSTRNEIRRFKVDRFRMKVRRR